MNTRHNKIINLAVLAVYVIALIIGLLNSKNNLLFIVIPCASLIWTILDTIYFAKRMPIWNKQLANDLGNVLLYQLPDLLAILFLKFDQPISTNTKIIIFILVIVNLLVIYLIDKKRYKELQK